jgi:hypothetical protein
MGYFIIFCAVNSGDKFSSLLVLEGVEERATAVLITHFYFCYSSFCFGKHFSDLWHNETGHSCDIEFIFSVFIFF